MGEADPLAAAGATPDPLGPLDVPGCPRTRASGLV